MLYRRLGGLAALAMLGTVPSLTAPPAHAGGFGLFGHKEEEARPPVVLLAEQIDELEESLNESGTIVAKKPDVWGESRMTKHRQEVEDELEKRIDKFELLLNASISRSDQAFFANALTIEAALGGASVPTAPGVPGAGSFQSIVVQPPASADADSETVMTSSPGQLRIATRSGSADPDGELGFASVGIGLEPTIQLDQLKRYLDHLNELRRLNEGGDTADAPGYSLNLVRIPVSVLPGDKTRIGHGAEITVTAETHLTPELLPTAFRTLVIQDLVDQLALPVLKIAEARAWEKREEIERAEHLVELSARLETMLEGIIVLARDVEAAGGIMSEELKSRAAYFLGEYSDISLQLAALGIDLSDDAAQTASLESGESQPARQSTEDVPPVGPTRVDTILRSLIIPLPPSPSPVTPNGEANGSTRLLASPSSTSEKLRQATELLGSEFENIKATISLARESLSVVQQALAGTVVSLPSSASGARVSRYAIPPSRLMEVFGRDELFRIAEAFSLFRERECAGVVHLSDARAFLAEELQAAYDFLLSPNGVDQWTCAQDLALMLRGGDVVFDQRNAITQCGQTVTRSLAWAVLVEAALLNERLNEDMRRVSGDPECNCMYGGPYVFFGPDPPAESRFAFIEYVRCRWPIHVFALDPVTQDQNLADQFSLRRELQLSAAIAVASGTMSASNASRFMRQITLEQETIALNTTAAAFAHGANTFGWRFYPRFQTAEIEGNATVLFRDLLCGGPRKDQLIRDYRIEPGMRECVALVVMPSFVPHVRFDIRSNWFQLTDPEDTQTSMAETVELSRKIRNMQRLSEICAVEADNYRFGETERLLTRVKQLSDKMPLQTVFAQVPYENTAGGFELFSSGVTDLGPELIDFYGAPGIGQGRDTALFLVGKNFSVHETKVIAGNLECCFELLSRDVMKVTVPNDVRTVVCNRQSSRPDDACRKCRPTGPCGPDCYEAVELHLATPYGVSGRLLVPLIPNEKSPAEAAAAASNKAMADVAIKAVAAHEQLFHPIRYGFAPAKVKGRLKVDSCQTPVELCLYEDTVQLVQSGKTPLGDATSVDFAAYVFAIGESGELGKFKLPINSLPFTFSNGRSLLTLRDQMPGSGDGFLAELWKVLANEPGLASRSVALRIESYVRPKDCDASCTNVTRAVEPLIIEIERCTVEHCGVGTCPTCPPQTATSRVERSIEARDVLPPLPATATSVGPIEPLDKETHQGRVLLDALERLEGPAFAAPFEGVAAEPDLPSESVLIPPPAAAPGTVFVPAVPVPAVVGPTNAVPMIPGVLPPTLAIQTAPRPVAVPVKEEPSHKHDFLKRLFSN